MHIFIFQTPLDLNEFRTNDSNALPLLHFILQIADNSPNADKSKLMAFATSVILNSTNSFNTNADGLDCTLKSSSGQKAGEMFPRQATKVLCKVCRAWRPNMKNILAVVRWMLAAGTDVNQCDENDESPLMHACAGNKHFAVNIIKVLVSHGANVLFVNKKNQTSLLIACENKNWGAAVFLYVHIMKVEADMPEDKRSNYDEVFKMYLRHRCVRYLQHVAEYDSCAYHSLVSKLSLSDACTHGYDLVVKHHLLHQNYSQNHIVDAAKIACSNNQSDVLHALMPHLPNSSVSELITYACQQDQNSFAHELFTSCTDHSTLPCPDISINDACKARQVDLVEFLIQHGKGVNKAADELGYLLKYVPGDARTLVHVWASTDDMYSPANVGVSLSAVNDHNCHPPPVYACMQGNTSIVKFLLLHGADVSILSDETPLTAACKHGHSDLVDILLHNTPNPSICLTNMYSMTPLQVAVKYHQGVIARRLINIYEADRNACKAPDTEFVEVTLMPQRDQLKSLSVVKLQTVSKYITNIVPEQPCWEIFLDPIKTEDVGTPPIVAAFQSKQYALVKFFIECNTDYQSLFEHGTLEDICLLGKVLFVQQFIIHKQMHTTQINYKTVLDVVVKLGNTDLMGYFLTHHQINSGTLEKAMIQACQHGSQDMVHLLIQHEEGLVKSVQHDSSNHCQHPLCIAIRNSDVNITYTLHKSGAQLFNICSSGTPLHHTLCRYSLNNLCSRQDEFSDILPQLLPECIDQNTATFALVVACKAGYIPAARLLVSKGADVNGCDGARVNPLCAAIEVRSSPLVVFLLAEGANPNIANKDCNTALYIACHREQFEIASRLIDAGADTNPNSCSPLREACERNYIDIVDLLLENKADFNSYWSSSKLHILNIAHNRECYEVVRLLLEYGAEPSVLSGIGFKTACELGYTEVAQHIIHESHISSDVLEQCIESAYKNGFLEAILEAIMDIKEQDVKDHCNHLVQDLLLGEIHTLADTAQEPPGGDILLWRCLEKRNIARMRVLIKGGYDVNIPNVTGRSLLQECIQQRIIHVMPDLCASQIHTDHRDSAGRTALFYSLTCLDIHTVIGESISVFEYLTSKGANVNIRDYFGRSVLHEWQPASDGLEHGPSLATLLKHIDINSTDHKGQTPLHLAVLNNNIIAVRQLLKNGANMEAHDINHITPLFLVHNNRAILQALQEDYPDHGYTVEDSPSGKDNCKQHVYMLNDRSKKHRLVPALKEVFHERAKYTQTDHFMSKYEPRVYYTMKRSICEEKVLFEETVLQMLRDVNAMVIQEEPVLSFTPRLSGSCAEGTKVIAVDEADMLCVFDDESWQHITLSQASNSTLTQEKSPFVQITSLSTKHQALLNNGFVSKHKLLQRLYSLIQKVLPAVLKNIKSLYMIDVKNAVANDHSLACLSMVWHSQVLPWQAFTVDIVPAIPVTQEQLPDGTRQAMSHSHIIQDLFVVPKTGTFDQSQSDVAFRLSFSSTERDLFLAMPAALKQGYMLAKVLVHDCITIDDIPLGVCSYNLKTATFECFKSEKLSWEDLVIQSRKTVIVHAKSQEIKDVVRYAQNILQEVERSFVQKHQDSFFLRGCNLLEHSIDKNDYRQILYVKYCAAMLSDADEAAWRHLAECVAQQLLNSKTINSCCFLNEIETLLDMDLKSQMEAILVKMIHLGQVEGVRMMLERGASAADVKAHGKTAQQLSRYTTTPLWKFLEDNVKGKL